MPKVSIIVPNYNYAKYLPKRIESIINQTFQDYEIILLDDSSSDDSLKILKEFAKHPKVTHFVVNNKNSGSPFKQWEKGIKLATGEYIWIAESDDFCEDNMLEILVSYLDKNSKLGITYCNSNWVNEKGELGYNLSIHNEDFNLNGKDEILNHLVYYNNIQNVSASLIRKDFIKKDLEYTKYKSCGDWFFYIELLSDSDIQYTSQKLNYFRWYHNNVSNRSKDKALWLSESINVLQVCDRYIEIPKERITQVTRYWIRRILKESFESKNVLILKLIAPILLFFLKSLCYAKRFSHNTYYISQIFTE